MRPRVPVLFHYANACAAARRRLEIGRPRFGSEHDLVRRMGLGGDRAQRERGVVRLIGQHERSHPAFSVRVHRHPERRCDRREPIHRRVRAQGEELAVRGEVPSCAVVVEQPVDRRRRIVRPRERPHDRCQV